MIPAWIGLAGLALTHYRILILGLLFLPAFWLAHDWKSSANAWRAIRISWLRTAWLGLGSGLLFLPWFVHVFSGKILAALGVMLSTPPSALSETTSQLETLGPLNSYLPAWVWLLIPLIVSWGLWKRNRALILLVLWWLMAVIAANPRWLNLPGTGILSSGVVFLAAYIPASALLGASAEWIIEGVLTHSRPPFLRHVAYFAFVLMILGAGLWGARVRLFDLRPNELMFVTRSDMKAAAWVSQNTPEEALFLVNSSSHIGSHWELGTDGGWWLPLLAHRATTVPPMIYPLEKPPRSDYLDWVYALPELIRTKGIADANVLALMQERGITYLYVGQRESDSLTYNPSKFSLDQILKDPHFLLIYNQDLVWIFKIIY